METGRCIAIQSGPGLVYSTITTESAPLGIIAPVEISTAVSLSTSTSDRKPASTFPFNVR